MRILTKTLFVYLSCLLTFGCYAHDSVAETKSENPLLSEILTFAKGHKEFQDLFSTQHEADFLKLIKNGQSPQTLFIACSDSRVVPDLILNTKPGDLFVIRTAGNFVPPFHASAKDGVSATIQYAVEALAVRHIIVCGHSHCGAIKGLFENLNEDKLGIVKRWISLGEQAKKMTLLAVKPSTPKEELLTTAEEISVITQLEHLMTYPFIKDKVKANSLELHGWYFKIETGEIFYYNTELYQFIPLVEKK